MSDHDRRFTDREVALVLKRATEIDEGSIGSGTPRGLSRADLESIAREVGISDRAIGDAVAELERGTRSIASWLGASPVDKAVRVVPASLDQAGISRLVGRVDERTSHAGTVTEALGSVRWTGSDRFQSTHVAVTPGADETTIEVVEKTASRLRVVTHAIPATWGVMFSAPVIATQGAIGIAVALGAAAAGALAGRGVWTVLAGLRRRRVRALADELADEARRLSP